MAAGRDRYVVASIWMAGLTCAAGLIVWFGWLADVPVLKTVRPSFVSMKANTALAFVIGSTSLMLWHRRGGRGRTLVHRGLAAVVLAGGLGG